MVGHSRKGDPPPIVENVHVPDVFVSGIARFEKLGGGMVRVVFYAEQIGLDGQPERAVVAKIVRPISTWPTALRQIAESLTEDGPLYIDEDEITPMN